MQKRKKSSDSVNVSELSKSKSELPISSRRVDQSLLLIQNTDVDTVVSVEHAPSSLSLSLSPFSPYRANHRRLHDVHWTPFSFFAAAQSLSVVASFSYLRSNLASSLLASSFYVEIIPGNHHLQQPFLSFLAPVTAPKTTVDIRQTSATTNTQAL